MKVEVAVLKSIMVFVDVKATLNHASALVTFGP